MESKWTVVICCWGHCHFPLILSFLCVCLHHTFKCLSIAFMEYLMNYSDEFIKKSFRHQNQLNKVVCSKASISVLFHLLVLAHTVLMSAFSVRIIVRGSDGQIHLHCVHISQANSRPMKHLTADVLSRKT